MNIFENIVRNRFWFLPTKEEQKQYRLEREENWKKDLPVIQNNINDLQDKISMCEDEIMKSEQAENLLKLKSLHQKLHFEISRQNFIHEELVSKTLEELSPTK